MQLRSLMPYLPIPLMHSLQSLVGSVTNARKRDPQLGAQVAGRISLQAMD